MRSIDAGISSAGCGPRVAVTTTTSSCASAGAHSVANARPPSRFFICARLPGMFIRVIVAACLWASACLAFAEADPALLAKLRQGGYVVYMRHASTDFSQDDSRMTSFEDCDSQ